jgi:tRNA threonylcarbamoyl adenosine modification protein YjeE
LDRIVKVPSRDVAATEGLAARLAALAEPGDIIALSGELGAGKTTFARGFVRALTKTDGEVPSPTFTLIQTYDTPKGPLWHCDLYRLTKPSDAWELGLEEAFTDAMCLIEWPERLGAALPARRLGVRLDFVASNPSGRLISLTADDGWASRLDKMGHTQVSREEVIQDFLKRAGWDSARRGRLAGDASFRKYDRLEGARGRAVLMDAPPPQEDVRPFVRIARHLHGLGFSVPAILAEDHDAGLLLLEDLGDDTYTRLLARGHDERRLYALAIDALIALHSVPETEVIPAGVKTYDNARLLEEVNRINVWFRPLVGAPVIGPDAQREFDLIWNAALPHAWKAPTSLVLFDYHVDNLLGLFDRPGMKACGILDFQDAVAGPVTYDLMSLLEDARRDIDVGLVADMKARYLAAFPALEPKDFAASWAVMAAQRHVRVIGTFARLKLRDRKPHYLVHMPRLWRYMDQCLAHPVLGDLKRWLDDQFPAALRTAAAS